LTNFDANKSLILDHAEDELILLFNLIFGINKNYKMRKYDRYQGSALTESFLDLKSKNINNIKLSTNHSLNKNP
jgi:hypothetical protein